MILNRYMYYLRYTSRKGASGHRAWRCINYTKELTKCPAGVITQDDVVVKRYGAHNHAFHDQKILKKVRDKAVFSTLNDAEINCVSKKRERCEDKIEPTVVKKSKNDDSTDAE
ncbi:uncharacterized protein LOC113227191 [Hyposmocoma kahamanoa]|uniref:uncharacterized protein LOC113227191 n=1 Tax=Hyposmocoma kahamanoa TaxID=1477025 RepID=UPI000E6D9FDD|nr:uncharacterized protein LOC113227191 [Hyposmocoma kahamanoa]